MFPSVEYHLPDLPPKQVHVPHIDNLNVLVVTQFSVGTVAPWYVVLRSEEAGVGEGVPACASYDGSGGKVLEGLGEVIADPTCSKDTPFQGWCCEEEGVMVLGCVLFVLVGA